VSTLPRFAVHAEMPIMIITNKIKQPQPDPQPQNTIQTTVVLLEKKNLH
jgi:hypothetical protein